MPRLSAWFVRASLIYLVVGFFFGALILAQKGIPYYPWVWELFPIHMEFLLVGWLVQLALGVAFWIVPRFSRGPTHGPIWLIWVAFILLNAGILITVLQHWLPGALLTGRIVETVATLLFIAGTWQRIKPVGVK